MSCCCGGVSQSEPIDADVRNLVNQVRPQIEAQLGTNFAVYEPIEVKKQVVSGMNYFVRINVGLPGQFLDARIYSQPWTSTLELTSSKISPSSEPLSYF
ncbi:hypothetical protein RCL1_003982 [Eukaryota sp. TZLM3-RCL]